MKKWTLLEEATTPDGGKMSLHTNEDQYIIRVGGRELMSTRHFASEERLAVLACKGLSNHKQPKVLIGGLGLGFTLRSALNILPPKATVVVAELIKDVVTWNENPKYPLASKSLKDPRTKIVLDDVARVITKSVNTFDAIMLDADNGTTAMSTQGNDRLYQEAGLAEVYAALKPEGVVVYWSAQAEPIFAKQLGKAGFRVTEEKARAHATGGGLHTLLVAKKL